MALDTRQGTQVACTGLGGTNPPTHKGPTPGPCAFQSGYSRKARCSADNAASTAGGRHCCAGVCLKQNSVSSLALLPWVGLAGTAASLYRAKQNPCPPSNAKSTDTEKTK